MDRRRTDDQRWMRRALELAARGRGRVEPNPPVGAVIVREGRLLAEAYHQRFGGPHAEVKAIQIAAARGGCRGATLYVTLEPCTGEHKKTPPCCPLVIQAGFARVVIGTDDPTQEPAAPRLEAAGIRVTRGVLEKECRRLISPFLTVRLKGRCYVIAKWAMTADGKIATVTGDARWVSGPAARETVHQWRNQVDAVLVGIGTVRRDDPLLTCRLPGGRNPRRVVLDAGASLAAESRLIRTAAEAPVIVACLSTAPDESRARLARAGCAVWPLAGEEGRVDLHELARRLAAEGVTNLMVEGGRSALTAFFERGLVDEVRVFVAPKIVGGATAPGPVAGEGVRHMADALGVCDPEWTTVGEDVLLTGYLDRPASRADGVGPRR